MRGASSQARGRRADIACGESSCQMAAAAAAAASAACDDSGSSLRGSLFCAAEASIETYTLAAGIEEFYKLGQLGALLSSPVLGVRLLTALQVLQEI